MKIAEIVGSYADRTEHEITPDNGLLQTIANAFTPSGKVKTPLSQQLPDCQPMPGHIPFSSAAASGAKAGADAVSSDAPRVANTLAAGHRKVLATASAYNSVYHR
jgi:hypothetical protein